MLKCFHRGDFLQIVDFQIIFCRVLWTGGLVCWTASWCFNGQLMYTCAITPFSTSNKRTLITDSHIATLKFWLLSIFFWIGIQFAIPIFLGSMIKFTWWSLLIIVKGLDSKHDPVDMDEVLLHLRFLMNTLDSLNRLHGYPGNSDTLDVEQSLESLCWDYAPVWVLIDKCDILSKSTQEYWYYCTYKPIWSSHYCSVLSTGKTVVFWDQKLTSLHF